MRRVTGYGKTIYVDTEVEISVDDIVEYLDDEDIKEMYEDAFGKPDSNWQQIYHLRRTLSEAEFLKQLDVMIMDNTGRIL